MTQVSNGNANDTIASVSGGSHAILLDAGTVTNFDAVTATVGSRAVARRRQRPAELNQEIADLVVMLLALPIVGAIVWSRQSRRYRHDDEAKAFSH